MKDQRGPLHRRWSKEKFLPDMLIAIRQDQVWGLTLNPKKEDNKGVTGQFYH
jgi:hypothetical protein